MQVEMIWEDGVLRPLRPPHLNNRKVTVAVPDSDVEREAQTAASLKLQPGIYTGGIGAELNARTQGYRGRVPATAPSEDKAIWHRHLDEKYLHRG